MTVKTDQMQFPHLIDIPTLAEWLGVGVRHVRRLVTEQRIPYIKWGHLIRFDVSQVGDWLKDAERPPRDSLN
jgi:excisionase family DNA binding protein